MLYWIEVYALVIGVLMTPFVLVYSAVVLSSFGAAAMRLMFRNVKRAWLLLSSLSRHHAPPMKPV